MYHVFLAGLSAFLTTTLNAAPPAVVSAEPAADWNAKFRPTEGWVGGDGAYSVPLTPRKTLWLFSDTFVGAIRDNRRSNVKMVNNSIGIQNGLGRDAALVFAIRKSDGKPRAMLSPPGGNGWFWLHAGIALNGRLQLFLPRIEKNGGGAFGFKQVELFLGSVANPDEEPSQWKVEYAKVPFARFGRDRTVSFGSALCRDGPWLYVFGYEEMPGQPFRRRNMLVARVPTDKLADFDSWRFLGEGEWKANVKDARPAAANLATEFSVSYLAGLKKYALVYTENGLSDRIVGRFAATPAGPWSEPILLYRCPEMRTNKKLFCYAAKAHPHLGSANELMITYCVNAFELGPVLNDARLYWPNFVRVKLK